MTLRFIILAMALVTFLLRVSFVLLLERVPTSDSVWPMLRLVPAATLSALIVPALVRQNGVINPLVGNARLVAGLVTAVVAWRTKNVLATTICGMGLLWLLHALR